MAGLVQAFKHQVKLANSQRLTTTVCLHWKPPLKGKNITVARIYSPHVIKKGVSRSIKMGQMQKKKEYYVNYIIFRTQRK